MPPDDGDPPSDGTAYLTISEPERAVLAHLAGADGPVDESALPGALGATPESVRGSLQRLKSKRLVLVEETHRAELALTPRGKSALQEGLPERRLWTAVSTSGGPLEPSRLEALGLTTEERSAAIGQLRRAGALEPGFPLRPSANGLTVALPAEAALEAVAGGRLNVDDPATAPVVRRGLVEVLRSSTKRWTPTEEGRQMGRTSAGRGGLGALTPERIREGTWRTEGFRRYDVRAPVPYLAGPRSHPYAQWLEEFEELLIGLGFEQAEGPLLETEFWNNDVLFMPQDHPARSVHDALSVEGVTGRPPNAELLARVAAVHEGRALPGESAPISPGWRAAYDPAIAARPVLRSQTTAVSARYLAGHPKPPFRMFCLDRNFRRESLDATHHVEFTQCEGVLGEEGANLRHLIGLFTALAEGIGVREMRFRPSYFPFTEPSIEGHVRHPRLGWMEVFPGGVLRPEVTRPLGLDVPVVAWGIGVMRLAMVGLGVSDIRELFDSDLSRLQGGG